MPKTQINNINIYYEIHGQGEPLIMVAGFSGDHTAFQPIVQEYAKHYQVILFDNRGIGQSDVPDHPYTINIMAQDTIELLNFLKIDSAHFLGHSMGGCIVQTIAQQHPTRVKSAILINSFPYANMRLRLYGEVRLKLIKANAPTDSIVKFVSMLCWSDKYLTQPGIIEEFVQAGFFPMTLKGYKHQLNALLTFDSREWLHKIIAPCLIINGDDDLIVSVAQAEEMANAIPNAEYTCLHNVGHTAFVEQPEKFNQLVLGFLAKLD